VSKLSESMYDYRPEREEPKVAGKCNGCGGNVYYGEEVYVIGAYVYCEDCVRKTTLEDKEC